MFRKNNLFLICFIIIFITKLPAFILCYKFNYSLGIDEASYFYIAHETGINFFTSSYPWGLPLFIKLFNYNLDYVRYFQFIISTLAWTFPLFYLKKCNFEKNIFYPCAILIILFVCSLGITSWDVNILTESLTFSFLVISISMVYSIHRYGYFLSKIILILLCSY